MYSSRVMFCTSCMYWSPCSNMPITFSCAHAHIVNKMANIAPVPLRKRKQALLVLTMSCWKLISNLRLDDVECVGARVLHSLRDIWYIFHIISE